MLISPPALPIECAHSHSPEVLIFATTPSLPPWYSTDRSPKVGVPLTLAAMYAFPSSSAKMSYGWSESELPH